MGRDSPDDGAPKDGIEILKLFTSRTNMPEKKTELILLLY